MAESSELDFSNMEGMDDIDWSDVESELQQNRDMIMSEASGSEDGLQMEAVEAPSGEVDLTPGDVDISFLLDIPLTVTVEVGKSKMLIKDLLNVNIDSIIELKKKVGDPLNVLVNDKLVAKGEAVVQNEKFALKITEVIDESERLKRLQGM